MPNDTSNKIWRYIDLPEYLALIQTERLHFTRGDQFNDPFEGSFPRRNIDDFNQANNNKQSGYAKNQRKNIAISCWHNSDYESDAMWRLYTFSGQGIAITTTIPKLEEQLQAQGYVMPVEYIDFINGKAEINTPSDVYHYKREAFVHENEVRAIITNMWDGRNLEMDNQVVRIQQPDPAGISPDDQLIEVELIDFIESITVSPDSKPWFLEVVKTVTESSSLKDLKVQLSSLSTDPVYANIPI